MVPSQATSGSEMTTHILPVDVRVELVGEGNRRRVLVQLLHDDVDEPSLLGGHRWYPGLHRVDGRRLLETRVARWCVQGTLLPTTRVSWYEKRPRRAPDVPRMESGSAGWSGRSTARSPVNAG